MAKIRRRTPKEQELDERMEHLRKPGARMSDPPPHPRPQQLEAPPATPLQEWLREPDGGPQWARRGMWLGVGMVGISALVWGAVLVVVILVLDP